MSLALGLAVLAASTSAHVGVVPPSLEERRGGIGIWKSVVPPNAMHGEFGNHDPIGLAAGQRIKVDCSLNWTDPDDGKLYCFNSATSLNYFLDWPKKNSRRARMFWERGQLTN